MEIHSAHTKAHSELQSAQAPSTQLATHKEGGIFAFVGAMMSVMKSITSANKGNAAMLNAQSAEAKEVAKEYESFKSTSSLQSLQAAGSESQSQLIEMQYTQNNANITQEKMGTYATNIGHGEQGMLTASLNAKAVIDTYSRLRTR